MEILTKKVDLGKLQQIMFLKDVCEQTRTVFYFLCHQKNGCYG